MTFPSSKTLSFNVERPHGGEGKGDSDQLPESFVRWLLQDYSKEGDKIFDPFFGCGSTIFEAEAMGRIPYGVEADGERYEWVAGQSESWMNLRCGDSGDAAMMGLPKMDLLISSPPFMAKTHKWNPLYGGDRDHNGYDAYLMRMAEIFSGLQPLMKRGALLCIHVENIEGRSFTPLVRDMSLAIGQSFKPVGETVIEWEKRAEDIYSRCLFFKA